jgi:hypothetical protein
MDQPGGSTIFGPSPTPLLVASGGPGGFIIEEPLDMNKQAQFLHVHMIYLLLYLLHMNVVHHKIVQKLTQLEG